MKNIAISVYALFSLILFLLCVISVKANLHLVSVSPDFVAGTFIPLTLFLIFLLYLQFNAGTFSILLMLQGLIAGGSLFLAMSNHAFQDRSYWLSALHLAILVIFVIWNLLRFSKSAI